MGSCEDDLKDLEFYRKPEGLREAVSVGRCLLETSPESPLGKQARA